MNMKIEDAREFLPPALRHIDQEQLDKLVAIGEGLALEVFQEHKEPFKSLRRILNYIEREDADAVMLDTIENTLNKLSAMIHHKTSNHDPDPEVAAVHERMYKDYYEKLPASIKGI